MIRKNNKYHKTFSFFPILLFFLFVCGSCGSIKYVPVKGDTEYIYRDTTIFRDSVVYIPKEIIKEVVPALDTLKMETNMAKAEAYLDTNINILRGKLENKKDVQYKYIYKDKIVYRDSIVTKEVPIEVVKPEYKHYWYEKYLWILSGIFLIYLIIKYLWPLVKKFLI